MTIQIRARHYCIHSFHTFAGYFYNRLFYLHLWGNGNIKHAICESIFPIMPVILLLIYFYFLYLFILLAQILVKRFVIPFWHYFLLNLQFLGLLWIWLQPRKRIFPLRKFSLLMAYFPKMNFPQRKLPSNTIQ